MKLIFILLGTISLVLGIIGIVIPILPTTPFLLLSATLYFHSSKRLYDKLLANKHLGSYIRNYREYKYIPLRAKIIALITLWATMLYSSLVVLSDRLSLQILLILIAIGVSWHILSLNSRKRE